MHAHLTALVVTFCLLIIFANSLDTDQAQQNVQLDLDTNCLILEVFLNDKSTVAQWWSARFGIEGH